jgi:hypothetical protein
MQDRPLSNHKPDDPDPGHGPQGLGRGSQLPPPQISNQKSHITHPNPQPLTAPPRDKPNLIDGRLLLAASALGCVVLFFIVWGSIRSVEQHVRDNRTELSWADRATWFAPSVIKTTLVKPNAANAQYTYNKPRYRDTGLTLPPQEEQAVLACATLAANPTFTDDTTRLSVLQHARSQDNFYAHYLLGTWHRLHGNTPDADVHYQRAFDLAPKVIVIRYTDAQGNPIPNLRLDRIEIGCDRVTDDGETLDQRLVLVYPNLTTDPTGRVYLPVYDTTYRPVYLPKPEGLQITYDPAEGWFRLPTRLGTIKARADTPPQ